MLLNGLQSYFCQRFASRCWYSMVAFGLPLCRQAGRHDYCNQSGACKSSRRAHDPSNNQTMRMGCILIAHRSLFCIPVLQLHHLRARHLHMTFPIVINCPWRLEERIFVRQCCEVSTRDRSLTVMFAVFRCCLTMRGRVRSRAPIVVYNIVSHLSRKNSESHN